MIQDPTYDQHPPDREYDSTVLIVDDEEGARDRLLLALNNMEEAPALHIIQGKNIDEATSILSRTKVHVLLLDKSLGPEPLKKEDNGIEAIPHFLHLQPHLQILMVSGSGNTEDVVQAMKNGACGYVTKQTPDDILIYNIKHAINMALLKLEILERERGKNPEVIKLAGNSKAYKRTLSHGKMMGESNRPVLILGPTGSGKTVLARWIDECRGRFLKQKSRPFFQINMTTLNEQLLESELFGHEKGSFTDASQMKQGFFELANNGTLFMDEIGEISEKFQKKLLTVIEEGKFFRMGGKQEMYSRPKLIFATNKDLEQLIKEGKFRRDLYERISSLIITMPPLHERKEDIPEIIKALLPRCCREAHVYIKYSDLPKDFIEYLVNTPFEGGIRGIEQQLDRLLALSEKDSAGRLDLPKWREIPGLDLKPGLDIYRKGNPNDPISLDELLSRPFALLGSKFPGLTDLLDKVGEKVLVEAMTKFDKNIDRARELKLAESSTYARLKKLEHKLAATKSNSTKNKLEALQ